MTRHPAAAHAPPPGCTQVAHLPERAVFYASVLPLLAYYALFACVLYPIAGSLHPLDLMRSLMPAVPVGLHGLLKVAGHW